jgi:hypothetical protein
MGHRRDTATERSIGMAHRCCEARARAAGALGIAPAMFSDMRAQAILDKRVIAERCALRRKAPRGTVTTATTRSCRTKNSGRGTSLHFQRNGGRVEPDSCHQIAVAKGQGPNRVGQVR